MDEVTLRGCLIAELKSCGKPNCRCARGELHGPYYYRRWRDESGRQRKQYVPREKVEQTRGALERGRGDHLRDRLREIREVLEELAQDSGRARERAVEALGCRWHGVQLRERRSFPAERRDRALYRMNQAQIVTAVGWEITEDDFVELRRMIRSERKRRNRKGVPWKMADPATAQPLVRIALDLRELPSYCACVAMKGHDQGIEVKCSGEARRQHEEDGPQ